MASAVCTYSQQLLKLQGCNFCEPRRVCARQLEPYSHIGPCDFHNSVGLEAKFESRASCRRIAEIRG